MKILGINHSNDAAAALVVDGRVIAASQEERFTRIKHDASFPDKAIDFCLKTGGLKLGDLDAVGFFWNPGDPCRGAAAPAGELRAPPPRIPVRRAGAPVAEAGRARGERRADLAPGVGQEAGHPLHHAPPVPRGRGLLHLALRGSGHSHRRRLRRAPVDHHLPRPGQYASSCWPRSISRIPSARSTRR